MSAGLQGAIESAPVTRLHEHRSYDPADFAVPGGREEEWRFTPLRRLRGLHTDTPPVPAGARLLRLPHTPDRGFITLGSGETRDSLPAGVCRRRAPTGMRPGRAPSGSDQLQEAG